MIAFINRILPCFSHPPKLIINNFYKRNTPFKSYKSKYNFCHKIMEDTVEKPYIINENNTSLFAEGNAKIYTKYTEKNQ